MSWSEKACEACREGAPPVSHVEIEAFLEQYPVWQQVFVSDLHGVWPQRENQDHTEEKIPALARRYSFTRFGDVMRFVEGLAEIAQAEGHHPRVSFEVRSVEVAWWTHKIRNLHRNDLICAAKTEALARIIQMAEV